MNQDAAPATHAPSVSRLRDGREAAPAGCRTEAANPGDRPAPKRAPTVPPRPTPGRQLRPTNAATAKPQSLAKPQGRRGHSRPCPRHRRPPPRGEAAPAHPPPHARPLATRQGPRSAAAGRATRDPAPCRPAGAARPDSTNGRAHGRQWKPVQPTARVSHSRGPHGAAPSPLTPSRDHGRCWLRARARVGRVTPLPARSLTQLHCDQHPQPAECARQTDGPAAEPTPKSPQLQELSQEHHGGPNPGDLPTFRPERLSGPGTSPTSLFKFPQMTTI